MQRRMPEVASSTHIAKNRSERARANRPGKRDSFAAERASAIIDSLADLVLPLRSRPLMPLCQSDEDES